MKWIMDLHRSSCSFGGIHRREEDKSSVGDGVTAAVRTWKNEEV